jgi:hypothetical protein
LGSNAADGGVLGAAAHTGQSYPAHVELADLPADGQARGKVIVLGEWLAQWLVAHGDDLGVVRLGLRGVQRAGARHAGFKGVAVRVVEVVQLRLQQRYGFSLTL